MRLYNYHFWTFFHFKVGSCGQVGFTKLFCLVLISLKFFIRVKILFFRVKRKDLVGVRYEVLMVKVADLG